jgi:hypothetical protein
VPLRLCLLEVKPLDNFSTTMRHLALFALLALVAFSSVTNASGTICSVLCALFSLATFRVTRHEFFTLHFRIALHRQIKHFVPHRADAEEFDLDQFASEVEVSSSSDSDADIGAFHQAIHAATPAATTTFKFAKRRKASEITRTMHSRSKLVKAGGAKFVEFGMLLSSFSRLEPFLVFHCFSLSNSLSFSSTHAHTGSFPRHPLHHHL